MGLFREERVDGICEPADGGGKQGEGNIDHFCAPAQGLQAAVVPAAAGGKPLHVEFVELKMPRHPFSPTQFREIQLIINLTIVQEGGVPRIVLLSRYERNVLQCL